MSSKMRMGLIAAVAALVLATVVGVAFSDRHGEKAQPAPAAASHQWTDLVTLAPEQEKTIAVVPVAQHDIPVRATVPGRIDFDANRVTPLFAQFSGRIVRLDVEVGVSVHAGQTLGILDSPDVVSMQAEYQEALSTARAARTSVDQSARTHQRAAKLAVVEAIPQRELQDAEVAEAHAREDLRRADASIAAARGRLQSAGFTDDEIERLDSAGSAAVTRLVALRAPVSGVIVERHLGLGQVVQPGGETLLKIADLSTVWVLADVYEDQLTRIHTGADVTIQTPAYPDDTFTARVDRVGATVDPEKRTIAVQASVPNQDGRLKPGMFATVVLQSGTVQSALVVPSSAIVATGDRQTVFVQREPGRYQERSVDTGDEIDGSQVVKSGLREGERVAAEGGLLLSSRLAARRGNP